MKHAPLSFELGRANWVGRIGSGELGRVHYKVTGRQNVQSITSTKVWALSLRKLSQSILLERCLEC
jgi:hypothetical protein